MKGKKSNKARKGKAVKHEHVKAIFGVFIAVVADDWDDDDD